MPRDTLQRRLCAHMAYAKGECEDEQGRVTKKEKNKIIIGITDHSLYFKRWKVFKERSLSLVDNFRFYSLIILWSLGKGAEWLRKRDLTVRILTVTKVQKFQ